MQSWNQGAKKAGERSSGHWIAWTVVGQAAYCIASILRARLIFLVTLRCCFEESPVYLLGKILPVSVI